MNTSQKKTQHCVKAANSGGLNTGMFFIDLYSWLGKVVFCLRKLKDCFLEFSC
jgi:hypothetical protein